LDPRLSRAIAWIVRIGAIIAGPYEAFAIWTGRVTVSSYLRGLAEGYHPVYLFAGIVVGFLFLLALRGTHLPFVIRVFILSWLFVFGHIFWGFC